jgi:DNA processing protein
MSDEKYWLGFNIAKGIGPAKLQALLNYFGTLENAWHAPEMQWKKVGLDGRTIRSLRATREQEDLDKRMVGLKNAGISLTTWQTGNYPTYLREIPNAPPTLYVKGEIIEADQYAVAIVGTRRLTSYGKQITRDLVRGLVAKGITIVSGLARGIDTIAHRTAVEMGGRTIAVLGSGIDEIYPPENRKLAQEITDKQQGAIISEYALGVRPEAKNFPPRNRVISGLSLGTVVVEAAAKSGALITANFAVEQDREVFAVPGNVNSPASAGPNRLIQQGAKLITSADDILDELNVAMVVEKVATQMVLPESKEEAELLRYLSKQPTHIDDLIRKSNLGNANVSSMLMMLELKGIVQQVGGMKYVLVR